jgi:hypothetical protein
MAQLTWRPLAPPNPAKEYLVVLTYLPLKSFWVLPKFFYYTLRIQSQLKSARGLVGYSLLAHVLATHFWTLSVWEDEAALMKFVRNEPHREIMMRLRRHMGSSDFVRWEINGSAVPPSWQEALKRLPSNKIAG